MWASRSVKASEQALIQKISAAQTTRRALLLKLAARAYELETGNRPTSALELVPAFLRALPKDSESGTNLVLHPESP